MASLKGKTLFITGASRGIGLAIAKRAAKDGANVVIAAKTSEPNPKLEGTIHTAAEEIERAGGTALPIACDVRHEDQVQRAVEQTVAKFGGIDVCVNNASAISLTPIEQTEMKRFDLMHAVNSRGTFLVSKTCLPHLKRSDNPHILMISPPLDMHSKWFSGHVAYSIAKYGMSLCVLGLADELKSDGIAVNALWPRTTIATAAVKNILGSDKLMRMSRSPDIVADAAHLVFLQPAKSFTGNFLIDDTFLHDTGGVAKFDKYRLDKSLPLAPDFFVPADSKPPPGVQIARLSELAQLRTREAADRDCALINDDGPHHASGLSQSRHGRFSPRAARSDAGHRQGTGERHFRAPRAPAASLRDDDQTYIALAHRKEHIAEISAFAEHVRAATGISMAIRSYRPARGRPHYARSAPASTPSIS